MVRSFLRSLQLLTAALALLAGAAALSTAAHGFTPNLSGTGNALKWFPADMPAPWQVNATAVTGVSNTLWISTFKKSMRTWMAPATSDLNFCVLGTTALATNASDGTNVLYAKNTAWDGPPGVLAITNYYFLSSGQITGTDMEFNGADFTWSTAFADERAHVTGDTAYDLQSIMTHELGHSIGFGHSLQNTGVNIGDPDYWDNGTPGNLADDQINGSKQNTMDPATLTGETYQRSLQSDDIAALDGTYPAASTTLTRPSGFLIEPDGIADTPTTGSYTIQWLGQYEGPSTPTVSLYYTQNIAASAVASLTGATLIAGGLTCPTDGSVAGYTWTFNNLPAGDYYVIAVTTADTFTTRDISPGPVSVTAPVLTVTQPNAPGITWTPFSSTTVAWTVSGQNLGAVKIDLSLDGGATYSRTLVSSAPNTGAYSLMVPDPFKAYGAAPQTQCKVRVSYLGTPAVADASDNNFTIAAAADALTLTAPNGGEFLTAGANTPVQFNASGSQVGNDFRILFSPDLGASWYTIENNITIAGPNPRTYSWKVPGAFGTYNQVRVQSVNNQYFQDTSDSPFTIVPNTPSQFTVVPGQLNFACQVGGAAPSSQTLTVLNQQGASTINGVTVTSSSPRVSVAGAPTSIPANSPAIFPISIVNTFPSAGTYVENVTINGSGVSSVVIPVTINVTAAGATSPLVINPTSLTFNTTPGSVPPGAQLASMTNPAGNVQTTVDVTASDKRILASPGRVTLAAGAAQNLTVLVDTTGYGSGVTKTSNITTSATQLGAGNLPVTVVVAGPSLPTVREKAHASPCALNAPGQGGGGACWALLTALIGGVLLRRRVTGA